MTLLSVREPSGETVGCACRVTLEPINNNGLGLPFILLCIVLDACPRGFSESICLQVSSLVSLLCAARDKVLLELPHKQCSPSQHPHERACLQKDSRPLQLHNP